MTGRVFGQSAVEGVTTVGMSLSGASTGVKLTYTCPAGRTAFLVGATLARFQTGAPSVHIQATIGGTTVSLASGTSNTQYTAGCMLNPGDTVTVNVVTLAAGATFDATISVLEYLAA